MIDVTSSGYHTGDCRAVLRDVPAGCVQTCITSPPYWGLRDYGVDGQLGLEASPELFVAAMAGTCAATSSKYAALQAERTAQRSLVLK